MYNYQAFVHFSVPAAAMKPMHLHVFFIIIADFFHTFKAMHVLFHQLANVYCPQKILYLIHNVG